MTPENALVKTAFLGVHNISHSVSLQEGKTGGGGGWGGDWVKYPSRKQILEIEGLGNLFQILPKKRRHHSC